MTTDASAERAAQIRIQALGAALSRRDWGATERAYEAIRDSFDKARTQAALRAAEQPAPEKGGTQEKIERAVVHALAWQATENGPGYLETRAKVLADIQAAIQPSHPAEQPAPEKGGTEALYLANRDKESILRRIDTEIAKAEADPASGEINSTLRDGRLGALRSLKAAIVEAGWIAPRQPSHPADAGSGREAFLTKRLAERGEELESAKSDLSAAREQIATERRAPVQGFSEGIPWSLHLRAWDAYAKDHGRQQTAERIAERGGFGARELDGFLPGWRAEVHEITRLRAERDVLSQEVARLRDAVTQIDFAKEARDLKVALAENAYPAADGTADIDNHALPIIEVTLRELARRAASLARGESDR